MEAPEVVPCPWFRLYRRLISAVSSRLVMMSGTDCRSPWSAGTPMMSACSKPSHPLPPLRGRRGLPRCASASARFRQSPYLPGGPPQRACVRAGPHDHPVVVHRVETELGGVNHKVVIQVLSGSLRGGLEGCRNAQPYPKRALAGRPPGWSVAQDGDRLGFCMCTLRCGSSGLVSVCHSRCSGGIRRGRFDCRSSRPVR
jgi:hypothetical protein